MWFKPSLVPFVAQIFTYEHAIGYDADTAFIGNTMTVDCLGLKAGTEVEYIYFRKRNTHLPNGSYLKSAGVPGYYVYVHYKFPEPNRIIEDSLHISFISDFQIREPDLFLKILDCEIQKIKKRLLVES